MHRAILGPAERADHRAEGDQPHRADRVRSITAMLTDDQAIAPTPCALKST